MKIKNVMSLKQRIGKRCTIFVKKQIPRNKYNEKLLLFDFNSKYISKRNKKKKKKNSFNNKLDITKLMQLADKPEIYRIYKRYGYMPKIFKRKLKRKTLKGKKNINI